MYSNQWRILISQNDPIKKYDSKEKKTMKIYQSASDFVQNAHVFCIY